MTTKTIAALALVLTTIVAAADGVAQEPSQKNDAASSSEDAEGLAKKLANPVASLISVPFQSNYDCDIGPVEDGCRYILNIQPVVPITLSKEWNLISRTILPVTYQDDIFPGAGDQFGLGDTVQSLFLSPQAPSAFGGLIWGLGPVFLIPTATDELLGSEKFGIGPTAVVLKQSGPWTVGALVNQIWSVAGDDDRADVSSMFLQPFLSYTTTDAWTFTLNTESTYNWISDEWSVPINFIVSKLVRLGRLPVSIGGGLRYWADSPEGVGPEGFGGRIQITFLFPK